jgi:hypothetical protein
MSQIIQCYLNSDLRAGHDGLAKVAKKDSIHVNDLEPGNYVLFINKKKNKLKIYAANHVVAYLKMPAGEQIDLNTIPAIPRAFCGSGKIDYPKILRATLERELTKRKRHGVLEVARASA